MVDQHVDVPASRHTPSSILGAASVPPSGPPANEGRTVAAWTTVAIIVLGGIVAGLGVALAEPWLAWVGGGVIVAGLVVGGVLRSMGYGQRTVRSTR